MRNFKNLGFPISVVLDEGRPTLRNSLDEVGGWLPVLPEVVLPRLSGSLLADVVHRKKVTAGGLGGCGWEGI